MEYWPETDDTLEIPKSIAFNIPPFEQFEDRFMSMKNNLTDYFSSSTAYNYRTRKITTQKIEQEEKLKEKLTLNETLSRWKWYSENWNSEKYFHESTGRPGLQDSRYVVKLPTREGNWKRETEIELIDAWLELAETNGILTWMAHGTLLSWFWGRSLFPWDKDSDFQIDASQLPELWKLNNTFTDNGRFFLDINPNSVYRTYNRQDVNRIDARVIDTLTGMYLDITALSKSKPNFKWVYCKSPHYYSYEDIYPLSLTVLEGIKILRPNKVVEMLEKEYKVKGTTIPYWRDGVTRGKVYYWDDAFLEWTLQNPGGINGSLGQNDGQPPQRRMIV
ncbi:hypothetical protein HK098_005925 [Nowakowskiella sp. JEL0407]|nr:hypothetical protein HK098_005925 [Nowakowskiella sp. JEL0407]